MNWDKAKNYTIIFLVVLNILLLGLNIIEMRSNTLTTAQKKDITQVLLKNSIRLNCEIPDKFSPMQSLSMTMYQFDYIKMQKIFFNSVNDVVRTEDKNQVIFKQNDNVLRLLNNTFEYEGKTGKRVESSDARKLADEYIRDIGSDFGSFSLYSEKENKDYYSFEYVEKYNRYNIFINSVEILIYKNGDINIKGGYYKLDENTTTASSVISADEALFSAIAALKGQYENGCVIQNIELGYYYNNALANKNIVATPSYRLEASGGKVFYVNAYSGAVEFEKDNVE